MADKAKADAGAKPAGGKRKLIILIAAGVLVLGIGGAASAYFLGLFGSDSKSEATAEGGAPDAHAADPHAPDAHAQAKDDHQAPQGPKDGHGDENGAKGGGAPAVLFVDLPDLLVNLRSTSKRMRYLKLRVALEVESERTGESVRGLTPRIMDSFQLYLRALDAEEVEGSAGMQKLKEELLARVNLAIEPVEVDDVLFREILVQ